MGHVTKKSRNVQLQAWLVPGAQKCCQSPSPQMSSGLLFLLNGRTVISSSTSSCPHSNLSEKENFSKWF